MENKKNESSEILLGLSYLFNGDVEEIINLIVKKEDRPPLDIVKIKSSLKSEYITILDEGYPKRFNQYFRPPLVMYYRGNFSLLNEHDKNVSLLNSKTASNYATESLVNIIKGLSGVVAVVLPVADASLVLANTAIDTGIKVILVSDRALDSKEYSDTQDELIKLVIDNDGLLVSEIPDGSTTKNKKHYLLRLMSLAALTTLVGAIAKRDAMIHGVAISLQLGNDVYCIPFNIGSNYINNELIKDGAFLVQEGRDVLLRHQQ